MKRAIFAIALIVVVMPVIAQDAAQDEMPDVTMTGTWELYRVDTIGTFTLNEYRSNAPTSSFVDATLVLEADGAMTSDSQTLRFLSWGMDTGFLYFETPSGNSFYKVRDLSPDVLFLVSVIVTERNAVVTQIEANENANLILVRAGD